jgi:arsenate reductase (thioredoxin)
MNTQYLTTTKYLGLKIMEKSNILFVCTGNSARSQMAEGLLRWYAGDYYNVCSAGTHPAGVHPMTIRVMEELGIDMSQHSSKSINEFIGQQSDFTYLITVCNQAEETCPYFPGMGVRMAWSFDDPAKVHGDENTQLQAFRKVRDEIESKVIGWLTSQGVEIAN